MFHAIPEEILEEQKEIEEEELLRRVNIDKQRLLAKGEKVYQVAVAYLKLIKLYFAKNKEEEFLPEPEDIARWVRKYSQNKVLLKNEHVLIADQSLWNPDYIPSDTDLVETLNLLSQALEL